MGSAIGSVCASEPFGAVTTKVPSRGQGFPDPLMSSADDSTSAVATSPGLRWSTCAAKGLPRLDVNQHTACRSHQIRIGISDEHAHIRRHVLKRHDDAAQCVGRFDRSVGDRQVTVGTRAWRSGSAAATAVVGWSAGVCRCRQSECCCRNDERGGQCR